MDVQIREGFPEGQLNINLAAMEADGRKSVLDAIDSFSDTCETDGKTNKPAEEKGREQQEISDTANLSDTARNREITPELRLQMMLDWTLEQLGKDWLLLLNFMPVSGEDPALLLEKLYALYHLLEAEIMKNTFGPAMQREMTRLDEAFSTALNRIWQFSMTDLVSFFETFGTDSQLQWLKSGVYYLATGERLSPKELERFWQAGNKALAAGGNLKKGGENSQPTNRDLLRLGQNTQTGNKTLLRGGESAQPGSHEILKGELKARDTGREVISGGYQAFTEKGSLYQARGREVTFIPYQKEIFSTSARTTTQGRKGEEQSVRMMSAGSSFTLPEKQGLFSARDLQAANGFLKYAAKEGSIFSQPYFNNSNEELLGILSAITAIKGREFRLTSRMGAAMGNEIQGALDSYIEHAVKQRDNSLRNEERQQPLQQREIYRTYYYTMDQYQKSGKADLAILEGLRYAVEVFQEKRLNTLFSQYKRYDSDSGLFHAGFINSLGQAERMKMDLMKGAQLLERDWKNFLKYIGRAQEKVPPFAGTLKTIKPQTTERDSIKQKLEDDSKHMRLFVIGALSFLILLLLFVRLFL